MKNFKVIIIIIVLIIIAGVIWYLYSLTKPTESEINANRNQIIIVPTTILSDNSFNEKLNLFKQNGSLPISIGTHEKGRNNPFADF